MRAHEVLAVRLRAAYNPRSKQDGRHYDYTAEQDRWIRVARAAGVAAATSDLEEVAAALHAAYVSDIPVQCERGWPPLAESERTRWLTVAAALAERERATKAGR